MALDAQSNPDDYPTIDWPIGEGSSIEEILEVERDGDRIRTLIKTDRGPAWTPWSGEAT